MHPPGRCLSWSLAKLRLAVLARRWGTIVVVAAEAAEAQIAIILSRQGTSVAPIGRRWVNRSAIGSALARTGRAVAEAGKR